MKKLLIADLIKQVQEEIPVPGDLEDAGIENAIHLPNIGIATYEHNPEHDVYVVTLTLDKGGETKEYVLNPDGLKDLIELGTKYFYDEMESNTFDMQKSGDSEEDYSQYKEYNPDMGLSGSISLGSLGDAEFQFDPNSDNYQVDIYFKDGSEAKGYILGGSELSDLNDNGSTYYNNELRVGKPDNNHWPFGSLDHLHWPNQTGK